MRTGPLRLDPHQARKIIDATSKQYFSAGRLFCGWYRKHQHVFDAAAECGDLLVEWKNASDGLSATNQNSVHTFSCAIAFIEHVMPR